MSNPIQAIRNVYDVVKSARDNNNIMSEDEILDLLKKTVSDEDLINKYQRFSKGYAAEDLFMRIYSLLPWVELVVPLGQEQFPELSKESTQVSDYEITFQTGSADVFSTILVEVKLVDTNKSTYELPKYVYDVLNKYAQKRNETLLFGLFWRDHNTWTINSIETFNEKSSSYKISFSDAIINDLSAIFGDYMYLFPQRVLRKSIFSSDPEFESQYYYSHPKFGKTVEDSVSVDCKSYHQLNEYETAVIDAVLRFQEQSHERISDNQIQLIETYEPKKQVAKLSSLILTYLQIMCCINKEDMYYRNTSVTREAFNIVDTVRRKCGGTRNYLLPSEITETATKMITLQFGEKSYITDAYLHSARQIEYPLIVKHID